DYPICYRLPFAGSITRIALPRGALFPSRVTELGMGKKGLRDREEEVMGNHDLEATWAYHNGTKHSYQSIRTNPHSLDWENQPLPFKISSALAPLPLPHTSSPSG